MPSKPGEFGELKARLAEVSDLHAAGAVLSWDQQTYMPDGGAAARGRQLATLSKLGHEKFTDPAIGKLLEKLEGYERSLVWDSDDAALIRRARKDYLKAIRVPAEFNGKLTAHCSETYQAWTKARPANDFASMRPLLEKTLDFSRRLSDFFPGHRHIADALIDFSDEGMTAESVRALFAQLRRELVPISQAITSQPPANDACLRQRFAEDKQLAFSLNAAKAFGYDLNRGRQDKTHHPFMTKFSLGDVRITTRVNENDLGDCLFSVLHETGHALYEQGINPDFEATPLGGGTSSGVHESQSRLWENLVGRSRAFWQHVYPQLQLAFPGQLAAVPLDAFYRAINKVEKSLIRTEADEVTYNLHVMIRFDLELALLEGKLAIKDLPEAWRERYKADLGVAAPSDVNGCLQDVHWFGGIIGGAFQGYTLGNIMSAQFFAAAVRAKPEIPGEISMGKFSTLHGWLKENVYAHGSKFTAPELLERATGGALSIEPYIAYLRKKFGEIYGL